ncbi:hypothetical protein [Bacteroides sp.]|uniref:hypothetical protein n=1 Tax=Bacteroides sp. TaxID=29523 RepID=UPI0026241C07|nr:hypothetical protein [Bacteroides sp.]MDD3039193.1 hypothetical protein [Bacteroides sp.]
MEKKSLYIFNPEHDLAMASGETNYMAPASARQMAADLALLPVWYAEKGAKVLAPSAYNIEFLKSMQELLGNFVEIMTEPEIANEKNVEFSPWGWDPALRKRLLSLGADEEQLFSKEYLSALRDYSNRSHAVDLLARLQLSENFCGKSFYLRTEKEWKAFVEEREACLLKAPLSGSGKGLNWCRGVFSPFILGWCTRVAASQGGVVGEPVYNKVRDFAMEFHSNGKGKVVFAGYSIFHTSSNGMYAGNELLSDKKILKKLSEYVPVRELLRLQGHLEEELSTLLGGFYKGYLGVDMMICYFSDKSPVYRIHPCVEINLRMNMGVVAHFLTDRYLAPEVEGVFQIAYYPKAGLALEEHQRKMATSNLCLQNGRLCSGYLSLVPVTSRSLYRAWIEVTGIVSGGKHNTPLMRNTVSEW